MTEEEREELRLLEARRPLTDRELDRLYFLRFRAAGLCTYREVLDQINAKLDELGKMAVVPLHTRLPYGWTSTGSSWVPARDGSQAELFTQGYWDRPKVPPR